MRSRKRLKFLSCKILNTRYIWWDI